MENRYLFYLEFKINVAAAVNETKKCMTIVNCIKCKLLFSQITLLFTLLFSKNEVSLSLPGNHN